MPAEVGAIYGTVGTVEFRFMVSDPGLQRMDYVRVDHGTDGAVLAQVMDIERESSLGADDVGHGRPPVRQGVDAPTDRLVAKGKVVGFRDGRGLLQAPRTPFQAGARVHRADAALITTVFGLDGSNDGAYLGFVKGYDLPVHLDINILVQKHVSVLAKTGSGKSYVVGVLMEELIRRGVPIVVIDPHGEHGSLARPNVNREDYRQMLRFGVKPRGYADHVRIFSPDVRANPGATQLTLDGHNLDARELSDLLGDLSSAQLGILHAAVRELQDAGTPYSLHEVLARAKAHSSNAKWNLVSLLEFMIGLGVFASKGTDVTELVRRNKVSVVNLKGVSPDLQEVVVARLSRKLFEARKAGRIPPFMLVVEEAHNFCPERGLAIAHSSDVLRTVASEGRKFGMGLLIVSQRPAKVDKNVLSQTNTQIILKVTNPHDLKAITHSVEGLAGDTEDEIQRLPVGVAIVSHPRLGMPLLCEVRPRETSHGGASVDIMQGIAAEYPDPTDEEDGEPTDASDEEEDAGRGATEDAGPTESKASKISGISTEAKTSTEPKSSTEAKTSTEPKTSVESRPPTGATASSDPTASSSAADAAPAGAPARASSAGPPP
ncbi:MAG TPA: DUF87 domain-containing protein, partial [Candidatus Thermoplasmatota archaeon]|nr:DUF87 domain-containing protein [Candidatus Thermoplasmatota archaeon]